jgi:hypothetical protein
MKRVILTMCVLGLLTACGGDFSPNIEDTSGGITVGTMDTEDDGTGGMDTDGGSTGGMDDTGGTDDGSTGDTDDGSTGETGEPVENPQPGDLCDPLLAFEGIAPCDPDPDTNQEHSCDLLIEPQDADEYRCVPLRDQQSNGTDIGDPCDDNGNGQLFGFGMTGCLNAFCLSNGFYTNPDTDTHINHPPGQCEFDQGGYFTKGCCTMYCDAQTPCDQGWSCHSMLMLGASADVQPAGIGACVWNG